MDGWREGGTVRLTEPGIWIAFRDGEKWNKVQGKVLGLAQKHLPWETRAVCPGHWVLGIAEFRTLKHDVRK